MTNEMQPKTDQNLLTKIIAPVVSVAVLVFAFIWFNNKSVEPETPASNEGTQTTADQNQATASKYKDGTYQATGTYQSPAGSEVVDISLTIAGDVVVAAEAVNKAVVPASIKWQDRFVAGFNEQVVSKNIDELNLTVVNGSSLTPAGFQNALEQIKTQALNS